MFLLFDIGGTKTRIAVSRDGESVGETVTIPTPALYADGIEAVKKAGAELSGGATIDKVGGGIAGPFSEKKASLVGSPNLKDWIGKPLVSDLAEFFDAPVHVENDSAICGLGEATYGAGRGFKIVAYITVSTGLGGARIVNGTIDEKSIGFEPGHQIIDADRTMDASVKGLHLGHYLSGKGIFDRTGKRPEEIANPEFWDRQAEYLAFGLNNTIVHWSPDVVVLGGSQIENGEHSIRISKVGERLREILTIYPELPLLKHRELHDIGGLWGALAYLKQVR